MTVVPTSQRAKRGASKPRPAPLQAKPTSLELFAGAGGLAAGVHAAGFEHLGLIEWDGYAVETLKKNAAILGIPPERIHKMDAREVDFSQFTGQVDLLSGGPPCQPFSTSGAHAGDEDERNMFPVFLDAIRIVQPKAILIENVKGLTRKKFSDYLNYIKLRIQFPFAQIDTTADWKEQLELLSTLSHQHFPEHQTYQLRTELIDTADFGVPQRRERLIFVAFRSDFGKVPVLPKATHSKLALMQKQWGTGEYWKKHKIEAVEPCTDKDLKLKEQVQLALLPSDTLLPWVTIRDVLHDLPPPVSRGETPAILNHVQHPGARIYPPCHMGSFHDMPAKALKAGTHGTPGGENILRSESEGILRYFTTREAGRLQTFPDNWEFLGTWGACIKQLGNAVPVRIGEIYATAIREQLLAEEADINKKRLEAFE